MKKVLLLLFMTVFATTGNVWAQRTTDKLDRGLVAVPSGSGSFVSWRIFAEEYYDTEYNLYRDGTKIAGPLKVSNYVDKDGKDGATYQVAAVVRGKEQAKCNAVSRLKQQYIQFAVKNVTDRKGNDITSDYSINDIALADVDGDGVSEFIMKRNYVDGSSVNAPAYNLLECYNIKGDRLWYIDLGPNMVSGPDEQYDAVGYDWDGDGKAEILLRGADNMIIHHNDGTTTEIGNMNVNTRNTVNQTANMTYTNTGAEYLLYLEGASGKPYAIGNNGALWMNYPLPRGSANDWGDGYGHRSTKHYFGAPFLDGRHPFIFLGRGCYTKHHMKAFQVDPATHKLTQYWEFRGESWPYHGQGFHNFGIADVDWDGRDEICFGSMVIDDNGQGLHTTGFGHGDAQHCSDFDPYRHGQEIFTCNEDQPAMNYRDGTTGKIYYRLQSTSDDGRALCGNFSNDFPGAIGKSSQSGVVSCVSDKVLPNGPAGFTLNFRIYWDGDLLEEGLDGASSREGAAMVVKADGTRVFTADGTANCNWTKNTPSATGDVLGDWREEIIARTADNKYVRVYTTNIATAWRNYSLWHDHQYRQGMVWESIGYNQPPHASYYLGEMEGITMAPPPLTMTDRTEVANNGTISAALNDKHVIVCETNDMTVNVAEGAKPYMVTFNTPSWVQGTGSTSTNGTGRINYTYYTCDVKGAAFTGDMRLVKQGDGTLNLPKVDMTYTGETNIWAGKVNFDGSMLNTSVWMNRFAELYSDGGKFRSIKMDYDSKLYPGRKDNIGTITTDSLLMGFGSRMVFDLNSEFKADQINAELLTIEKKIWQYGPKYQMPVFQFNKLNTNEELAEGKYLLGQVKTLKGKLENIKLEGLSNKQKSYLALEEDKLYLIIENQRDASQVIWTGAQSSTWDLGISENFADGEGESMIFVTGDQVTFNDEGKFSSINISDDVETSDIVVNRTKDITLMGTGSIVGNSRLVKQGSGKLTINTENSYKGGNRISEGVVVVSSLANANQAKGNLGAVTSNSDLFIIENGAELNTTAAVNNGSPIKFMGEEGGVINNANDFIAASYMTGTKLTKKGNGWMKLNTSNSSLERLVIAGGTVQCINAPTPAKTVEFQGGRLDENTGTSYNIYIPKGKSGTWNTVNDATYSNTISGEGTLTVSCPVRKGGTNPNYWYATRTRMALRLNNFAGILTVTSNGDPGGRFTLDTSNGMPNGTLNIPSGVVVLNSGRTLRIGKVVGNGSLGGNSDFGSGVSGTNAWEVGNDENWTTNVVVTANAQLIKVGTGKVTWSAACNHTGATYVNEGEMCIKDGTSLGTGALTVKEAGTLSGNNSADKSLKNSSYTIHGMVKPGAFNGSTTGTLYFGSKNVNMSATSTLVINAAGCATSTYNGCSFIGGINTLTMNGTIIVTPSKTNTLAPGDSIRLWKANSFSGTPKVQNTNGITWDTSRISEGILIVKDVDTAIRPKLSVQNPQDIYDSFGRMVRQQATTLEGLKPGIYVIRGRKYVVR